MDPPRQVSSLHILSEGWGEWSSAVWFCRLPVLPRLSSACHASSPFLRPAPPDAHKNTMEANGVQCCLITNILQNIFFVLHKVIRV